MRHTEVESEPHMTKQTAATAIVNAKVHAHSYEELLEGLNLSESAKSQIVALGAYALSTEYIEQLRKDAIVNANCARSYADDYNQAQSVTQPEEAETIQCRILDYYAHNATLFSSNASFGFRLADELERAAETPEVLKRLQENVAVSS